MQTLYIDIETYSDADLQSYGARKYVDSDNFRILLFAYAFNEEPAEVIDFTQTGTKLPQRVAEALVDPKVIKTAFNATFEITCLAKAFPGLIKPEQWECDKILAHYHSIGASLATVGKALGLPEDKQKDARGKRLITYFCKPCKPTKKNGGRTVNLPEHAPEDWEIFKEYNRQDVVTERAIRHELEWLRPDDAEHDLWLIDQRINDRGVAIDTDLVKAAIAINEAYGEALIERAKELTGLENPNSVAQLKEWFKLNGHPVASLNKETVEEMLKDENLHPVLKEVLRIRARLGKTSIKKYIAMRDSLCKDGRAHNLFQFYGASRTGRWCLTGDHEVLTPDGWSRLDEWAGGEIACWNSVNEVVSFSKAKKLVFDYAGEMVSVDTKRCAQVSTPDHKMAFLNKNGFWEATEIKNLLHKRPQIPFHGRRLIDANNDSTALRILIMTQADGHYTKEALRFHFSKQRKIERCKRLLRREGIAFIEQRNTDNTTVIAIRRRDLPMYLRLFQEKTFGAWLLNESADVFFDELEYWDGYRASSNSIQYTSTIKQNADFVQALAIMSDRSATMLTKHEDHAVWSTTYVVNIWTNPGRASVIRQENFSRIQYDGKVYCAETKTGFFITRRMGKVWVTGNSGRNIQLQNLPRNYIDDLETAREAVKSGDIEWVKLMYGNVPDTLSQLIRTAIVPAKGKKFVVADFSAIEARVLAWLADETWVLDAFRNGKDIYCETASQMFGVPVEKHGQNSELRQKGKVAVLSCGYGGGVGALKAMGGDKMGLSDDEMQHIVDNWRKASPNIVTFWARLERAARIAVQRHQATTLPHGIKFMWNKGHMIVQLPSKRVLVYLNARMGENKFGNPSIVYDGVDMAKKAAGAALAELETYSGKLAENITQAVARDCLAIAMKKVESAGYPIVAHIHDELVLEVPDTPAYNLATAIDLMTQNVGWNKGLPLNAAGFESYFYMKD